MKILILQPWISWRGAESVSVAQAYWLNKLGHEAKIACIFVDRKRLPDKGEQVDYLLPPHPFSYLAQRFRIFLFLFGWLGLLWILARQAIKFDVLNAHNLPTVWLAVIFGKFLGKTVVWTVHTVPEKVLWKEKKGLFEYLTWFFGASFIDTFLVKKVDLIISTSEVVRGKVKRRYKRDSLLLQNGVNVPRFTKDIPGGLRKLRRESDLVILQVGTLHSQKNPEVSLRAFAGVLKKYPRSTMIFAGEGPDRAGLEALCNNLKINNQVCFAGFVPPHEIESYYQICDLHLLPSVRDTFPAAPLEALACAKPSIISKEIGVSKTIGDFCIVLAKPSVASIYKGILKYIDNKSYYNNLAHKGKEFILKNFSWRRNVKRFIGVIKNYHDREVSVSVYSNKYFGIHHEYPSESLRNERITRLARALNLLELNPGMKVLDLGCGNGELAVAMAQKGALVWGVDYSESAIELAERRLKKEKKIISGRVRFFQMDAKKLEFDNNLFDRVVALDVFEHIYPESLLKVLSEIKRVVKRGGRVVVETSPNQLFIVPMAFLARKLLGRGFESDEYHINLYNYFRFKKNLNGLGGQVWVDLVNDGHQFFSSRISKNKFIPGWMKIFAKIVDFVHENPMSEFIILNTPLKIFLAHDLWGVVRIKK